MRTTSFGTLAASAFLALGIVIDFVLGQVDPQDLVVEYSSLNNVLASEPISVRPDVAVGAPTMPPGPPQHP